MASKQSEAVRELYLGWTQTRLAGEEQDNEHWGNLTRDPGGVDYIETGAGGVPAMWVIPKEAAEDRVLLCIHGGGFIGGSIYTHRKLFGHLAKQAGARALSFNYRLAPEHRHPAALEDATTVYRWLLDQQIRPARIAFTGDSSGGGLCLTTQLRARERGLPLPAAAMPFSPWVDMEVTGESYHTNCGKGRLLLPGGGAVAGGHVFGRGRRPARPAGQPAVRRPGGLGADVHPGGRRRDAPR